MSPAVEHAPARPWPNLGKPCPAGPVELSRLHLAREGHSAALPRPYRGRDPSRGSCFRSLPCGVDASAVVLHAISARASHLRLPRGPSRAARPARTSAAAPGLVAARSKPKHVTHVPTVAALSVPRPALARSHLSPPVPQAFLGGILVFIDDKTSLMIWRSA